MKSLLLVLLACSLAVAKVKPEDYNEVATFLETSSHDSVSGAHTYTPDCSNSGWASGLCAMQGSHTTVHHATVFDMTLRLNGKIYTVSSPFRFELGSYKVRHDADFVYLLTQHNGKPAETKMKITGERLE